MADKNIYDILVNVRLAYRKAKIDKDFFSTKEFDKKLDELNEKIKKSFEGVAREFKFDKIFETQTENFKKSTSKMTKDLTKSFDNFRVYTDNIKRNFEDFGKAKYTRINLDNIFANYKQSFREFETEINKTKKTFKSFWETPWGRFMSGFFKIYIITMMIKMITNLGLSVYNASKQFRIFNNEYSQFLGRTKESETALKHFIDMANKYGVSLKNINNILKNTSSKNVNFIESLFGLSSIAGEDIAEKVATTLENIKDRGKVSINDLNELARSGFFVWEELAKRLNMTYEELSKIEKGVIDTTKVIKILEDYFANYVKTNNKNINETDILVNRISNNWKILISSIEKLFNPLLSLIDKLLIKLKTIVGVATNVEKIEKLTKELSALAETEIKYTKSSYEKFATSIAKGLVNINSFLTGKTDPFTYYLNLEDKIKSIVDNYIKSSQFKSIIITQGNSVVKSYKSYKSYEDIKKLIDNTVYDLNKVIDGLDKIAKTDKDKIKKLAEEFFKTYNYGLTVLQDKDKAIAYEKLLDLITSNIGGLIPYDLSVIAKTINNKDLYAYLFDRLFAYIDTILSKYTYRMELLGGGAEDMEKAVKATPITLTQDREIQTIKKETTFLDLFSNMLKELEFSSENEISAFIDGIYEMFYSGFSNYFGDVSEIINKYIGYESGKLNYGSLMGNFYTVLEAMLNGLEKFINELNLSNEENIKLLEKANDLYMQTYNFLIKELEKSVKKEMELRKKDIENKKSIYEKDILNKMALGLENFFSEEEIELVVTKSVIINGQEYKKEEKETIKTGKAVLDLTKIFDNYKQFINVFTSLDNIKNSGIITLFGALSQIPNISYLLNPLATTLQILTSNIMPVLNDLLQPFIGFMASVGIVLAQFLIPIFRSLFPITNALANVFAILLSLIRPIFQSVLTAILPIINIISAILVPILKILGQILVALTPVIRFVVGVFIFLANVFTMLYNAIATIINSILWLINVLTKANIGYLNTYTINWDIAKQIDDMMTQQALSTSDLLSMATGEYGAYGYALSQSTSGSGITTEAKRPITVNVNVENWFGDEEATRKLALIVKNEFEILGIL